MRGKRLKVKGKRLKVTARIIKAGVLASFIFSLFSPASAQDTNTKTLTDEQKMEQVRSYFESEYQEEDFFRTDRLLLTATGSLKSVHKAPAVASVITAEDIEKLSAMTLDEVLETVPGLYVAASNYNRLNSTYSIRGIHTKQNPQVLLLLDSIPVTNIQHGNRPDTFTMSVAKISRIEIIRGPGSAVHGADAFAGVINVITKEGQEIDGTTVSARGGSFGSIDTWFQHGANYGGWDVALTLSYLGNDGDTERIIDADLATLIAPSASLAPGPLETDDRIIDLHLGLAKNNWTFRLWGWQQNEGGNGAGIAQILDPVGYENQDVFVGDLSYSNDNFAENWGLDLRFSSFYLKTEAFIKLVPDGATLPIGADGNIDFVNPAGVTYFPDGVIGFPGGTNKTYAFDFTSSYKGIDKHSLRFGAGFKYLDAEMFESKNFGPGVLDGSQAVSDSILTDVTGTPDIFMEDTSREIWHVLLQDEWSLTQKWELTGGVRYDHYSDFGGTTNPRLALVWETRKDLTAKLLYGRAFRPPSFAESYYKNNPSSIGNPALEPETIDTLELAFDYQPSNTLHTNINVFAYEIENLIEYITDAGQPSKTAQNAKDQEGYGFELEADWQMFKTFQLKSNFAYQHSEDKDTGEIVPDAPALQYYLNGHWMFLPEWSLDVQYYWIGNRKRAEGDPRSDVDNYSLVNLSMRRKNIARHIDLALYVKNIFDEDIREPTAYNPDLSGGSEIPGDYPMEGRSIFGELRVHF